MLKETYFNTLYALVNTLITNVVTRKQEFAMLKLIGMTDGQLTQMIQAEGLMLSLGNGLITLILGSFLGFEMISLLRHITADYMHFTFPIWYFKKQSLVERLRESD